MATIEQREASDGTMTHRVKVRLKGFPTQSASFKRKTDAQKWAQAIEVAMREGRHFKVPVAKRKTLNELIERYIRDVLPQRPKNASNTLRHLKWWRAQIGFMVLADIQPSVVAQLRDKLLATPTRNKTKRSNATVQRYLAALSHAFSIAVTDWEWAQENPVRQIRKPRAARGRERFLSDAERDALLLSCKASPSRFLYSVVVLAISTGMRSSEILGLRWHQVDLKKCCVRLTETKNDTSRTIPLAGLALETMVKLAKVRRLDTDIVFYGKDVLHSVDIRKPWETARRKAGLTDFRFHDLRHTAASYLAMNGATTVEIAAVLGHKTLQMELNPNAKQSELIAALEPVQDRIMKRYKVAVAELKAAKDKQDTTATKAAQDGVDALTLFKGDMAAYVRLYTFLSQIFDYGNTGIEKRAMFYKRLLPLLEFGREREGIDLSKVVLTHHSLKDHGSRTLPLGPGESPKLAPITGAGSGSVQEQQKVYMAALIEKLNDLFGSETSEQDQLRYVNGTLLGKVAESAILQQQAANNSREQFANSPDLHTELQNAIMESYDAHTAMSTKALNSPLVMHGLLDILLNHAGLYERLRGQSQPQNSGDGAIRSAKQSSGESYFPT